MASMISGDGVTEITEEHVGKRAIYTDREKRTHPGTIRDVAPVAGMVDIDQDHSTRPVYYVPSDTITLVPDEVAGLL